MSSWSQEEMISLHNTECDDTAVAFITQAFQQEPQLPSDLIRHTLSWMRGEKMNAPVSKTKYPQVPLASRLTLPPPSLCLCTCLPTLKPQRGLSRPEQDNFCLHRDGGGGGRARTKEAFIAVSSGWLRTDNGHILQLLKQIAVCSRLPC